MAFIFEGEFDFRAIGIDFAVADNHFQSDGQRKSNATALADFLPGRLRVCQSLSSARLNQKAHLVAPVAVGTACR